MHELRNFDRMPHEFYSILLGLGAATAVVLAAFAWYLRKRHGRPPRKAGSAGSSPRARHRSKDKRRKT